MLQSGRFLLRIQAFHRLPIPSLRQLSATAMFSSACSPSNSSKQDKNVPIHILGSGSIGLLYACGLQKSHYQKKDKSWNHFLSRGHQPVTLLMRSHHKNHLKRNEERAQNAGYFASVKVVKVSSGTKEDYDIPVELIGEENHGQFPIQNLLLCTKANDAVPALASVWDRLLPNRRPDSGTKGEISAQVIILSNGALAIRDAIRKHFGINACEHNGLKIILATTTHGAYRSNHSTALNNDSSYSITHAGEGSTFSTNADFINNCKSIGWDSSVLSELDMNAMLWKKLAVNCVINPLTAIHNIKNGELLNTDFRYMGSTSLEDVMSNVLKEVSSVATLEMEAQYSDSVEMLGRHNNIDARWMDSTRHQLSVPVLKSFVTKVLSDTANNVSSMLQDVRSERITEVRYLNGYVTNLGSDKYSVDCPWNEALCVQVEEINRSKMTYH